MFQADLEFSKFNKEMELAQRVQSGLLSKQPPVVKGLDIWAATRPAYQVGGDFYDFFLDRQQNFTFAVGDICGKGMSAAMLMPMTRMIIRTAAIHQQCLSPEEIINRSNGILYEDFTNTDTFASAFVGSYDPLSRKLMYANAGHSPVIYYPVGGKARYLEADGTPIGVLPVSLSKNHWLNLQSGDVLIAGTDGLVENYYKGGALKSGYRHLLWETELLANQSARSIAESMFDPQKKLNKLTLQNDDQTLVVIKCL